MPPKGRKKVTMPNNASQTATEQAPATGAYQQSGGGAQDELVRTFSALLDEMRQQHYRRPPGIEPDPLVGAALKSVAETTRQLVKPGVEPLPKESRWDLPAVDDRARGRSQQ